MTLRSSVTSLALLSLTLVRCGGTPDNADHASPDLVQQGVTYCNATGCGGSDPPPPPPSLPPSPGPLPGAVPQGLTCGMVYIDQSWGGLFISSYGRFCPDQTYGYYWDGDWGQASGFGFGHGESTTGGTSDPTASARFQLPRGTACGFHHTRNTPASGTLHTCMGHDPANADCPFGWTPKKHFDMSSTTGYWVWCEYQDPYGYCNDTYCMNAAFSAAYACGVSSDTDSTGYGECAGLDTRTGCPGGLTRAPWFDSGRGDGQGVAFCY